MRYNIVQQSLLERFGDVGGVRGRLWIARLLRLRQHFDVGKFDPERKRACKAVTTHWGAVILLEQALRHLRTLARRA